MKKMVASVAMVFAVLMASSPKVASQDLWVSTTINTPSEGEYVLSPNPIFMRATITGESNGWQIQSYLSVYRALQREEWDSRTGQWVWRTVLSGWVVQYLPVQSYFEYIYEETYQPDPSKIGRYKLLVVGDLDQGEVDDADVVNFHYDLIPCVDCD